MKDKRYTKDLEFCGYAKARYVLRFCGQFISAHESYIEACNAQEFHATERSN